MVALPGWGCRSAMSTGVPQIPHIPWSRACKTRCAFLASDGTLPSNAMSSSDSRVCLVIGRTLEASFGAEPRRGDP